MCLPMQSKSPTSPKTVWCALGGEILLEYDTITARPNAYAMPFKISINNTQTGFVMME